MLDVPWFAEKVQRCIDEATTIGLNLKSSLEAADAELFRVEADRDRLKAALEMLAQCRHVSGSAQGAFRCNLRITDAVLAGADVRDVDTVEAIVNGEWKPTENQS
jgi:hypothetical protein